MVRRILQPFLLLFILSAGCTTGQEEDKLPDCEWCGTGEAPQNITWETVIAGKDEPGEPLIISGKLLYPDGSPAEGVIVYAYHTNSKGIYPKRGDEKGNGKRHGYLRSWMKTDKSGNFRFTTIRPASYPNSTALQHIHLTVQPPESEEYYIPEMNFSDDPLLKGEGSSNGIVLELIKDNKGIWRGAYSYTLTEP